MNYFMQTIMSLAFVLLSSGILTAQTFNVDSKSSELEWIGKKVTGQHNGTVKIKSGKVMMKDGNVKGNFTIDMTTINVEDLEGEYKTKLENHLRSDDFFSVDKHNTASFKITDAKKKKGNDYEITGDLTIKGITNNITFPAEIMVSDKGVLEANADITIDRTKWKIKYGSGSFFDDLGDKMIYDDVDLNLRLSATK